MVVEKAGYFFFRSSRSFLVSFPIQNLQICRELLHKEVRFGDFELKNIIQKLHLKTLTSQDNLNPVDVHQ